MHNWLYAKSRCLLVYKIPYRRARAWPTGCIVQPLGRVRARAKVSCIQVACVLSPH